MGKSKKRQKNHTLKPDKIGGIRFELEEDAHELLVQHLDAVKPEKKEADSSLMKDRTRPSGKALLERTIDLHGFRLDEATNFLSEKIESWLREGHRLKVCIITGKGRHSDKGGGVLAVEIHRFVMQRFKGIIQDIEASPDEVRISGLPIRGHFHVTFAPLGKSLLSGKS